MTKVVLTSEPLVPGTTRFHMLTEIKKAGRQPEAEHEASPGRVFWITGLSGAGKTTVGQELSNRLRAAGRPVTFLDGDALRTVIETVSIGVTAALAGVAISVMIDRLFTH